MATVRLTDALVRRLQAPATGNRITYDSAVTGFGARITAADARSYVLTYVVRGSGRQRRYTIGGCDRWTATDARAEARRLKALIDQGGDPLADIEAERTAPNMADLVARFQEEHFPRLRKLSADDYGRLLRNYVLPHFSKHRKVAEITFADVDALHRKITKTGATYQANRVVAMLSKMFSLAMRWGWRTDNPCRSIERNKEHARQRYLTSDELARLVGALAKFPDRDVADVFRLLLLTGARRNEVLTMRWEDLNLTKATWSKPPSYTKQGKHHSVPLSAPVCQLLADRMARKADGEYVFAGNGSKQHLVNIWRAFQRLCKTADIEGLRIHDLRHSYASTLVSAGHSLPLIGALLGHSQPQTTARYAHLFDDPLRKATEQVGQIIENAGKPAVEPLAFKPQRGSHGHRS